jgi:hypothetical protein
MADPEFRELSPGPFGRLAELGVGPYENGGWVRERGVGRVAKVARLTTV